MKSNEKVLKDYTIPCIKVEIVTIESGIAQASFELVPGDETGVIQITEWEQGAEIPNIEGDSRW